MFLRRCTAPSHRVSLVQGGGLGNACLFVRCRKHRIDKVQELRWTHRALPDHAKMNLSPLETQYFRSYDRLLNQYCRSGRLGVGLDLTAVSEGKTVTGFVAGVKKASVLLFDAVLMRGQDT